MSGLVVCSDVVRMEWWFVLPGVYKSPTTSSS